MTVQRPQMNPVEFVEKPPLLGGQAERLAANGGLGATEIRAVARAHFVRGSPLHSASSQERWKLHICKLPLPLPTKSYDFAGIPFNKRR